jgi:hypothetical protein
MRKLLLILLLISVNSYAAEWQCVEKNMVCQIQRMQVADGWLVITQNSITFVPDPQRKWKL